MSAQPVHAASNACIQPGGSLPADQVLAFPAHAVALLCRGTLWSLDSTLKGLCRTLHGDLKTLNPTVCPMQRWSCL